MSTTRLGWSVAGRRAFSAAHSVDRALSNLAARCEAEFGVVPDFAPCVHAGSAAIGEVGDKMPRRYTTAGPAIELAQGMRAAARRKGAHILLSVDVLQRVGAHPSAFAGPDIERMDDVASLSVVAVTSLDRIDALFLAGPSAPRVVIPNGDSSHWS